MHSDFVKTIVHSFGAEICGIASIERFKDAPEGFHPLDIYSEAKAVIVFGKQFPISVFESSSNVSYTLVRNKLIEMVDNIAVLTSLKIEEQGYRAVPIPSSEPYEYWDSQNRHGKGILSLKHSAQAAGIGCIGKNTLLLNEKYGNRLWLGAVITNIELKSDPLVESLCIEGCNICLEACPQSALDGMTINQKKCREISATSTDGGGMILSCNVCRKTCPFSRI
jgi:epoxyqueuosine reductase QueG